MAIYSHRTRVFIGLAAVLLLLFISGWYTLDLHFRHGLEKENNQSKNELSLISFLVKERLQKQEYQLAKDFILYWGKNSPEIVDIVLSSKNGFEMARYNSLTTASHQQTESIDISYSYDRAVSLKITRSLDKVYANNQRFLYQLLSGYLFVSATLYFLVVTNLRIQREKHKLHNEVQQRIKTEKLLQEREQDLNITLDSIADAVIATDKFGNVARMNPVAEQLTGWPISEARGKSLKTIFPIINASTREKIINPVEKVLKTGEIVYLSNHTTLISRNGTEYQIADSAAPIRNSENDILGMVLVFNDVTEEYRLRESAAKNKRDLQAIMDNSPAVIYVKDTDGRYLFINRQFEKLFHIQRDDIPGKTDHDIFPKKYADDYARVDSEILAAGSAQELEEFAPVDDGKVCSYASVKFPLLNEAGIAYAICSISTDNTERKMQEEQLRHSQKIDALGKLTGGIAHDYNNLLGIIIGYSAQLNECLTHEEELSKYSNAIQRAAERGAILTKKLLSFSRHKTPETTVVNISKLLQEQRIMIEKSITSRIHLTYDIADDIWPIMIDSGDLEDTIVNMSINAMHAMPSGGNLTIRVFNEHLDAIDARQLQLEAGDYVLLSITDTGSGMNKTTREKIFDPFFTTKGERGTGLGLSQVYGFVQRSGGSIKVYSELDHGSRFTLYFPRSEKSDTGSRKVNQLPEQMTITGGNETILIVDDEPALVELADNSLTRQGYHVLTASDGIQALSLLKQETVDLVVSDVIMPNMDGYQLAAQVQKLYPSTRILMVSGFADDRHKGLADEKLVRQLLYKPYTVNTLMFRIRNLLDKNRAPVNQENTGLNGRRILVMDDEEDVRKLYEINLRKLGCKTIPARGSDEAITFYRNSLASGDTIDALILDLQITGDIGGKEVAEKIRAFDPGAKMIVSSGHQEGPEMTRYADFGFQGALKKTYELTEMEKVIKTVLFDTQSKSHPDEEYVHQNTSGTN